MVCPRKFSLRLIGSAMFGATFNLVTSVGVRAGASLSLPDGQDKNIYSILPHFPVGSLIFPQIFFIFFLILVFRVGDSPTRKDPGYATGRSAVIFGTLKDDIVFKLIVYH